MQSISLLLQSIRQTELEDIPDFIVVQNTLLSAPFQDVRLSVSALPDTLLKSKQASAVCARS